MESLFKHLFTTLTDFEKNYWVALSGGLDSVVLLHAMTVLRQDYPIKLHAIHIHHGLSPNADEWQKHCENLCRAWSVDFFSEKIHFLAKKNIEEEARSARYAIFKKYVGEQDFLLTAHHEDDQAETVLLQLLRGAGPKGLAAMPAQKKFGKGFLVRPFLSFNRAALEDYANKNNLSWILDESNFNAQFTRNFLRHEVLSVLKKRWPSVTHTIARVAKQCAMHEKILQEKILEDLHLVMDQTTKRLSLKKLLNYSHEMQAQILRAWLQHLDYPTPHERKMQQIQRCFLQSAQDRFPLIRFADVELRRYRDEVFAMKQLADKTKLEFSWDLQQTSLILPNIGKLTVEKAPGKGFAPAIQHVQVRFRVGGELCLLPGRDCHHELKKLFQAWGVPPWLRSRIPLVFFENQLIAVLGYFMDERFAAKSTEYGHILHFKNL